VSRLVLVLVVALAAIAIAVGGLNLAGRQAGSGRDADAGRGGNQVDDPAKQLEEQLDASAKRVEAYQAALKKGTAGQERPAGAKAALGWLGERPYDPIADDREPAIATDLHAPLVYALATRYGTAKPCPKCPVPYIVIRVSADNGVTWSGSLPVCECKGGKGQFHPVIEVVPNTGDVYVLFMGGGGNGFNVFFTKSSDHGKTWSTPAPTWGDVAWTDKPVIAVSDDGRDVYAAFNGPTGGDPYVAQSHDAGATWTQSKLLNNKGSFHAFDGDVDLDGRVFFAESSVRYSGSTSVIESIDHHVFISTDRGASFTDHVVATVQAGMECVSTGCKPDFYAGHVALSVDPGGGVTVAYDGAAKFHGPQRIDLRRSTDHGASWSKPQQLSNFDVMATSPAMESGLAGNLRLSWMETSGLNLKAWNVWYVSTNEGGASWSSPIKVSDATSGASYKTAAGFLEVYGDYGELAVTNTGKSIAIWGEGSSWYGPGGIWFNRER
jgi:hypothetical protein